MDNLVNIKEKQRLIELTKEELKSAVHQINCKVETLIIENQVLSDQIICY